MRRGMPVVVACAVLGLASSSPAQFQRLELIPRGGGPVDVGPIPEGLDAVDARSCGGCHEAQLTAWRGSAHADAGHNPVFLRELARRPRPFCVNCHGPRTDAPRDGVDCATCHVRGGHVLNPTVSGRAPHASQRAPVLGQVRACARCHEFDFEHARGEALQRTVSEWRTARRRARMPCQGCHLPSLPDGTHDHGGAGLRDPDARRRAVEVTAEAQVIEGRTRVRLAIRATGAGHAVPTGDMFRQLEVTAWPSGAWDARVSRHLRRHFGERDGRWRELADTRVPADGRPRTVELWLPSTNRVAWGLWIWRAPPAEARRAGWDEADIRLPVIDGMVEVE